MSKPSVIVIGAGLAGLSTGCYAQMNGYQCRIFEHARHPGGVAAEWKRKGYTIDGGIHFYMGSQPGRSTHDLYRELGIFQESQYLEMTTYGRFLDLATGQSMDITNDMERLSATMKALSSQDSAFVERFFKGVKAFKKTDISASMNKPPDITNWWDTVKMFARMWRTLRYYSGWTMQPINKATKDLQNPWLAYIFNNLFLPDVPVVFILMLLGALSDGNLAIRRDGSGGFARALEKRYLDLGGEVTYRSTVEKILVEKDRAVGVRLENGEEHRADRIISAADGFSTLYHLLGGRYMSKQLKDMHEKWPLWRPVVLINYGVARDFASEPSIVIVKPMSDINAGFIANNGFVIRIFNYCTDCAPAGRTLLQVMVESAWQPWKNLKEDQEAYEAEKEKAATHVLEHLNEVWPGIKDQVDMTNVATPHTWWRFTRNREGSFEGFAITSKIFTTQVRRTLPGLESFIMAGQWVVPGGGVVPTLISGKQAAMLMCHQDGVSFRHHEYLGL